MSCKCTTEGNETTLIIGSENRHDTVVGLLIRVQANVNQCRITNGTLPLIIGSERGYDKVVELLIRAKANVMQMYNRW